jgi:replication-associated recombination protein RarA
VEAGDLPIIARRLMVIAYEDIGLANMPAANRAVTAVMAAEKLGFPEARIPLAMPLSNYVSRQNQILAFRPWMPQLLA